MGSGVGGGGRGGGGGGTLGRLSDGEINQRYQSFANESERLANQRSERYSAAIARGATPAEANRIYQTETQRLQRFNDRNLNLVLEAQSRGAARLRSDQFRQLGGAMFGMGRALSRGG